MTLANAGFNATGKFSPDDLAGLDQVVEWRHHLALRIGLAKVSLRIGL